MARLDPPPMIRLLILTGRAVAILVTLAAWSAFVQYL